MAKVPPTALSEYLSLGPNRSYETLARKYGCSKKAITKRATKERWQERIAETEEAARKAATAKSGESMAALHDRHLRTVRMVQARAIETLKATPLRTAMDAVRALTIALKEERELLGLEEADRPGENAADGDLITLKAVLTAQYPFIANLISLSGSCDTIEAVKSWGRAIRGYEEAWIAEDPRRTQAEFRCGDQTAGLLEWISRTGDEVGPCGR